MSQLHSRLGSLWLLMATGLLAACGGGGGGQTVASLNSLALSSGTLVPAFQASTTSYTASVPFGVSSVTVTAGASASTTITVNGSAAASGVASAAVALNVGANQITVVASADGATNRSYTITVTRQPEVIARLSDLVLSTGSLDAVFDPTDLSPSGSVGFLAASVTLAPTAALAGSTISVAGVAVASGSASAPISLAEGVNEIEIAVSAAGATAQTYTLTLARQAGAVFLEEAEDTPLPASTPLAGAGFGNSVAFDGDTLAIGVPTEGSSAAGTPNAAPNSGAVFIYVRNGVNWTQQAFLKASNAAQDDAFGASVALEGDLLVVGAPFQASPGPGVNFGGAYVFRRSGGTWTEEAPLKAGTPQPAEFFGSAVAVRGGTVAVGAPGESTGEEQSGAVYVFGQLAGSWQQRALLKSATRHPFARFGSSLALDGELLVAGAVGESTNAAGVFDPINFENAGAAYVFTGSDASWDQLASLKPGSVIEGGQFGASVAVAAGSVAVGSTKGATLNPSRGQVFVFQSSDWTSSIALNAGNVAPNLEDRFGSSLALVGELLVVGAPSEGSATDGTTINPLPAGAAELSGAAYLFKRDAGGWSELAFIKATDNAASAGFGAAVALSGNSLAVGAPGVGKVYVID
jgi:hypothetical protein